MNFWGDKRSISLQLISIFLTTLTGCNQEPEKPAQLHSALTKPVLMQPFRFHKLIEVSPGNSFDVFSWGRGSDSTGSLLILKSDSTEKNYTTTTGDLEGAVTDVYNTDMDMDGNPEILIQAKAKDSTVHTQIYAFEYKDNRAQKLNFPKLTSSQRKGYRGEDNFFIKEGILMRQFPIFDGNESSAKPTSQKRLLEYGLRSNNFTVKTVEQGDPQKAEVPKDSVKNTAPAALAATKNTSQKKHRTPKRKRKTEKSSHKRSSTSGKKHHRHRR